MLKLSNSRGIRIDVAVLSVSWFVVDHAVIIQALKKGISSTRPVILEESLAGSPLVQIVWQRLQCVLFALAFHIPFAEKSPFDVRHRVQPLYVIVLDIPTFYQGNIIGHGVVFYNI